MSRLRRSLFTGRRRPAGHANGDLAEALEQLLAATTGEVVGTVHLAREFTSKLATVTRQVGTMQAAQGAA